MADDDTITRPFEDLEEALGGESEFVLLVVPGGDAGAGPRIPLGMFGSQVTIGRGSDSDLPLNDTCMSRRHATLSALGAEAPLLRDEGSRNGTFVNGMRLGARAWPLHPGDVLRLGSSLFVLLQRAGLAQGDDPAAADSLLFGSSPSIAAIRTDLRLVAASDLTVLIVGESGTGKELVAREIHRFSGRTGPLVDVNCGSIPATLAETTLFGHAKGAFTGAQNAQEGLFAHAHGGTLFLDEIGELPLSLQPKLLRVIENHLVTPVGSTVARPVDVRVVAATNVDLKQAVAAERFRGDLLARLEEWPIRMPTLRERREDVVPLFRRFLAEDGIQHLVIAPDALEALLLYPWPYNVRELRNLARRLARRLRAGAAPRQELALKDLPDEVQHTFALQRGQALPTGDATDPAAQPAAPLTAVRLREALDATQGNVSLAARRLGVSRSTMYRRLREHGLVVEDAGAEATDPPAPGSGSRHVSRDG